jgi:hypothetical protein
MQMKNSGEIAGEIAGEMKNAGEKCKQKKCSPGDKYRWVITNDYF